MLFALVIAPALESIGPSVPGLDYMSFAAIGTAGLLIPLNCMFAGIGVIVDRESGRGATCSPRPSPARSSSLANLAVPLAVTALQVAVLLVASVLRGAELQTSATGIALVRRRRHRCWRSAMYGVAETLANRMPTLEEYTGALPTLAIVPWFFAGSLFPISALPSALTAFAKVLPLTHASGADALRPRRPGRRGAPRHLGHGQHRRRWPRSASPWSPRSPRCSALVAVRTFTRAVGAVGPSGRGAHPGVVGRARRATSCWCSSVHVTRAWIVACRVDPSGVSS